MERHTECADCLQGFFKALGFWIWVILGLVESLGLKRKSSSKTLGVSLLRGSLHGGFSQGIQGYECYVFWALRS